MMYFYHNSCVVSFEFRNFFKIRCESIQGFDQLGVVVSLVGKDKLSRKLYQKIAQYCDILQQLYILKRLEAVVSLCCQ